MRTGRQVSDIGAADVTMAMPHVGRQGRRQFVIGQKSDSDIEAMPRATLTGGDVPVHPIDILNDGGCVRRRARSGA